MFVSKQEDSEGIIHLLADSMMQKTVVISHFDLLVAERARQVRKPLISIWLCGWKVSQ